MKISELWLREWVNPVLSREDLCEALTMAGLEIEDVSPVAERFSGVVVGHVISVEKHPEADRLHVCQVATGGAEPITIVCGAKNVVAGMKTAAALEGAVLSNKMKITASRLRGVLSHGMLCSARELGLSEESDGLIVLPPDAREGENIWDYLNLTDHVLDISITPNRGDCLSVLGLAQDVAAITETKLTIPTIPTIDVTIPDALPIVLHAQSECPHYVGRVIRGVTADAATPIWMQERLRRSGIRSISPIVDVMNYVMLELGQPMHAFDLAKIAGGIQVRLSTQDENLELLDGQAITLDSKTLIIADEQKPLAMAGVMGGMESAVTLLTQDIFLESAFFQPTSVARMARQYKLNSESAYRFERGVDPTLQVRAIERATQLILEIAGGEAGPVIDISNANDLPQTKKIILRAPRIKKILGLEIADEQVTAILQSLGFVTEITATGWNVMVPARRFDMDIEEDLIEEIIRIYGYQKVPQHVAAISAMQIHPRSEKRLTLSMLRHALRDMSYHEVVTYSFIDKKMQNLFDPMAEYKELLNPITAEMSVMRTSLWPGLVNTCLYNHNRQQSRVRIFESGLRFVVKEGALIQERVLSGLISGGVTPEQWGVPNRQADFFDLKGDLENIIQLTGYAENIQFRAGTHPALHPGQTAEIYRNDEYLGVLGVLHPSLAQKINVESKIVLFELLLDKIEVAKLPRFNEISKFPEIRRDIAILVNQTIPVYSIQDTIRNVAGELLQNIDVFDVYQGKGITAGHKSVALALTLQHASRTLVDEEVADLMRRVIVALKETFAAELRG
jgi:phenylalanyl-tRNA synthetase beta chain